MPDHTQMDHQQSAMQYLPILNLLKFHLKRQIFKSIIITQACIGSPNLSVYLLTGLKNKPLPTLFTSFFTKAWYMHLWSNWSSSDHSDPIITRIWYTWALFYHVSFSQDNFPFIILFLTNKLDVPNKYMLQYDQYSRDGYYNYMEKTLL